MQDSPPAAGRFSDIYLSAASGSCLLTTDSKKTLPMFVQLLSSNQFRTDYGVVYVGLFVTIIPLVVVYLVLSKYIVAGVALGGVKG